MTGLREQPYHDNQRGQHGEHMHSRIDRPIPYEGQRRFGVRGWGVSP